MLLIIIPQGFSAELTTQVVGVLQLSSRRVRWGNKLLVVLDSEHIVVAYKFNIGLPVIWDAFPLRNLLTR